MKKYTEIIGIIMLLVFSFYYTSKVASLTNNNDALVSAINTNKDKYESTCKEGIITSEGIILGNKGKKVDEKRSYNNMIGKNFNKDLLIYYDVPCKIIKEDNYDKYIIKGNSYKNSVSLIIKINDFKYLKDIINITKELNIKIDIMLDYKIYEENKLLLKTLLKDNYYFVYNGNVEYYENFKEIFKDNMICTNIEICSKDKINSIKINNIINKNYLNNIKDTLEKGSFIFLEESKELKEEIKLIINYINAKGINIISLKEHLN